MELVLRGEMKISDHKRELIVRRSGCRLQSSAQPNRAAMLALGGTALQLRHAAQLLLKEAKGKGGVLELQVAADDSQADWVLGKSGGTLQMLRQEHAGVAFEIRRPHGDSDRYASARIWLIGRIRFSYCLAPPWGQADLATWRYLADP